MSRLHSPDAPPWFIDGDFCLEHAPWLTWADVKYGFEKKYINAGSVIRIAAILLSMESSRHQFDLANCSDYEVDDISKNISFLSECLDFNEYYLKKVYVYLFLIKLYLGKDEYGDPLRAVEELYADLDYPDYMSQIVRYMPAADGEKTGEGELIRKWEELIVAIRREFLRRNGD